MNEKDLFEKGCFLPSWAEDVNPEVMPISQVHTARNKDLQTLLTELEDIKGRIQDIHARQWHLARLLHFHENNLVKE